MTECAICVEPFSAQKRKQITCEYCDFEVQAMYGKIYID